MISISNLGFRILESIFKNPKSIFSIPLESHCETQKFQFSDIENPHSLIFASKFKFLFDQNLDFVLGQLVATKCTSATPFANRANETCVSKCDKWLKKN